MVNINKLFPIGIGTWKINYENFSNDIDALLYSYRKGQNYLSLYMMYNDGQVVKCFKEFIHKVDRESLFLNINLEPPVNDITDIEKQLNEYLEILNIDYVDNFQLHTPKNINISLRSVFLEMKKLQQSGKVRHLGISNCTLEQLKEINELVDLDFFEGVYNLECKANEDVGILDYCNKNNITYIAYQVLRRNRTANRNYPVLLELSEKYNKSQNQIILNWVIKEKNIKPIIKCTDINRINENLESLNFEMEKQDYEKLNNFRSEEFDNIKIDWNFTGEGITIDQLPNQFN